MKEIKDVVTWLKNWFYDKTEVYAKTETYKKSEVDTALNGKLNKNLTTANKNLVTDGSGDIILEDKPVIPDVSGKIDTAGTGLSKSGTTLNHSNSVTAQSSTALKKISFDTQGHITGTANVSGGDLPSHPHNASQILDSIAHPNIGTNLNAFQNEINTAIDTAIGNLQSIRAIEVVSSLPTASSSTMGKLYIVSQNSKVNVYYTKQNGSSYSWQKMDTDILDELSIDWSEIENNPFSNSTPSNFATASHAHGNITNDGKIGTTSGNLIVTGTGGVLGVTSNILTDKVKYTNNKTLTSVIGDIYDDIDNMEIAIGNATITSIALVPKSTDANGKIIFYTGDEPT